MYLKRMIYENVGPIEKADITLSFNTDDSPIPLLIVGKNGSGKSILLSHITDALYELASLEYSNALINESNGSSKYYKIISSRQISIGKSHLVSYLSFEEDKKNLEYVFKSGDIAANVFFSRYGLENKGLNWEANENFKKVKAEKETVKKAFGSSIVAFFPPTRYDKPSWLQTEYYENDPKASFFHKSSFFNELKNPISVSINTEDTLNWILDVIADSKAEVRINEESGMPEITHPSNHDISLLSIAKENVEVLLSAILGEQITLRMGYRSSGPTRLVIYSKQRQKVICPSLDSLSTGELALFNIFATLIRYADSEDINNSFRLSEIKGIAVIDEIDLHLHSSLQFDVLPRLIKLFPKVQFIITTHSPLFLLGMKKTIGEKGIDIYELPKVAKITTEAFSEFENAYAFYSDSVKHHDEIVAAIKTHSEKPLIVTEGSTDWKHLKAAFDNLKKDKRCSRWINKLDFEFLEYEPLDRGENEEGSVRLQMSCSELKVLCENEAKLPNNRIIIFIADNDDKKTREALSGDPIKNWGNNVFSMCLPVPSTLSSTDDICIEMLYPREQVVQTCDIGDGIRRRIFFGSEFNSKGTLREGNDIFICPAMGKKHKKDLIIDGSDDKRVFKVDDMDEVNYALPKNVFARYVLEKKEPFNNMDFSSFIRIFEIIRDTIANSARQYEVTS